MEHELLQVLDEGAAGTVHDALGHAGRPRAIEDVERMVEGEMLELERRRIGDPKSVPPHGLAQSRKRRSFAVGGDHHHPLDRGNATQHLADLRKQLETLAAITVGVGREEDLGLDLPESVDHAAHPEIGRGGGPDRPETRGRQHRDHGLGNVRHVAGHPIPRSHPGGPECRSEARNLAMELGIADFARRDGLAARD